MKTIMAMLMISVFLTVGCVSSTKYIPDQAFKQPIRGISIPHPETIEEAGVKNITTFLIPMDAGLFVEVVEMGGVWPLIAKLSDGREINSDIFLLGLSWKGDFLLQASLPVSEEDLSNAKILFFNRDAGFAYSIDGQLVPEGYNPKKFQKNKKFREDFFNQHGKSLVDLENFWNDYCPNPECTNGYPIVKDIEVGSPDWIAYKNMLYKIMGHAYKDKFSGRIVISYLKIEQMREIATQMPGFYMPGRWVKNWLLPIIGFGGIDMATSVGTSVVTAAVDASIRDDYEGHYARATVLRYQLAPVFRDIISQYKLLLKKRDDIIYSQEILLSSTSQN